MKVNVTEVVDHNFVLWRLTQPVNAGWNYLWGSQFFDRAAAAFSNTEMSLKR